MYKITVIGAGSWGTALATILAKAGNAVKVISLTKRNLISLKSGYHPNFEGILLPKAIEFTSNIDAGLKDSQLVIFAVSSNHLREALDSVRTNIQKDQLLISVIKGLEKDTLALPSQIISLYLPQNKIAVLTGPSHAEEVIKGEPFGLQLAVQSFDDAKTVREAFENCNVVLPYTDDLIGAQLGGALKNIIAIGYGIALEQSLGTNFYSMLVTAAMTDLRKLAVAGGAYPETVMGLSGLGDLITTISSPYSRNRKFGQLIGSGIQIEQALEQVGMVVEGLNALNGALELAEKYDVNIPVIRFINDLVEKKVPPTQMTSLVSLLKQSYQ